MVVVAGASTSERPERSTPVALLYLGLPAYVLVVMFTMRDVFRDRSTAVAVVAVVAALLFSAVFFWLASTFSPRGPVRSLLPAVLAMAVLAVVIAVTGVNTSVFAAAVAAMAGDGLPLIESIPIIAGATVLVGLILASHGSDV